MRIVIQLLFCLLLCSSCFAAMGIGDSGDEVLAAQKNLVSKGYFIKVLDGRFDYDMENAVKSFQFDNKLKMTGELDKETYLLLMNEELPSRFSLSGLSRVRQLVGFAMGHQGVPYIFGGVSPRGFDCSGFIQFIFGSAGILLPRLADEQYYASERVKIPRIGDLVFFETYTSGVSHVGLYLGNNEFIHASCSKGVTISSLDEDYWGRRYIGAGRIL